MIQTKQKMPETLSKTEMTKNGADRINSIRKRMCPRCKTGYLHQMQDIYGVYIQCLSCGHSIENQSLPEGKIAEEYIPLQNNKPHEFNAAKKGPELRHWQRVIHYFAKKHPKPRTCLWPECEQCKIDHKCCIINKNGQILCGRHQRAYIQAFEVSPPRWSEMNLPVPYGVISISYFVERVGSARNRQRAWASAAQWNIHGAASPKIKAKVKRLFLAETGLKLEWLEDALLVSEKQKAG